MNRKAFGLVLGVAIVVVATQTTVFSDDKVERREPKSDKVVSVSGKITEETPGGVKIKAGTKETLIPAHEIHRVFYDDMPIAGKQAYINLWNLDDTEKDLAKVQKAYQDFVPRATGAPASIRRNIDYRLATLGAAIAESKEQKAQARLVLGQFISANPTSWQFSVASRQLARMQIEAADFVGAQRTLEGLTKNPLVPAELRGEADLMLVDVLFQSGKTEEVKAKIDAALKDPKTTEEQKTRFAVYQTAIEAKSPNARVEDVVKNLEGIIARTNDGAIKALAYNVMGDCYAGSTVKDAKRHAMWSYLWVDVVYNQDRAEHMKAMNNLLKIFEDEKDTEKVQLYKEKIARMR